MVDQSHAQQAMDQIRAVYEDGKAEINGREYVFTKMTHKERRKVFAFFTRIQGEIEKQNFWWLEDPDFVDVEDIISKRVTFDGNALNKLDKHWENYPQDYILFITTALGVISYPFLPGSNTG